MIDEAFIGLWRQAWILAGVVLGILGLVLVIGVAEVLIAGIRRQWRNYQVRKLLRDVRRRAVLDRRIGRPD